MFKRLPSPNSLHTQSDALSISAGSSNTNERTYGSRAFLNVCAKFDGWKHSISELVNSKLAVEIFLRLGYFVRAKYDSFFILNVWIFERLQNFCITATAHVCMGSFAAAQTSYYYESRPR